MYIKNIESLGIEYLAQKCKLVGMGAKCLGDISERVFVRFPIDFCVRSTYPNAKPLVFGRAKTRE